MPNAFLSNIYLCNRAAKWVFSIANNHACDTSRKSEQDVSGVEITIDSIRSAIPDAEIVGAEIGLAKSVLSFQVEEGPKIGLVGWTEVMNHDKQHHKKKIIRETDITDAVATQIRDSHDMLFGFAHGNEEQSYHPLKETRDRWCSLIDKKKFDVIVGHGPHVLHPGERVGEEGLLFHSIGNFCSPVGKSQTKIGCVPEVTIHHQKDKISFTAYKIHLLQQQGESLSLIEDLNAKSQVYPGIIHRLKNIWKTLF
jgi:poly-gamma-glutamate capsule biosynthesis protein CapA/YwtB (metallophosphatase superfamily)